MRIRHVLSVLACLALLGVGAQASECVPNLNRKADVDTGDWGVGPRYYFENDSCDPECIFSMWIYEESNGIPGLQRHDEIRDDTCKGKIPGDTIVW